MMPNDSTRREKLNGVVGYERGGVLRSETVSKVRFFMRAFWPNWPNFVKIISTHPVTQINNKVYILKGDVETYTLVCARRAERRSSRRTTRTKC